MLLAAPAWPLVLTLSPPPGSFLKLLTFSMSASSRMGGLFSSCGSVRLMVPSLKLYSLRIQAGGAAAQAQAAAAAARAASMVGMSRWSLLVQAMSTQHARSSTVSVCAEPCASSQCRVLCSEPLRVFVQEASLVAGGALDVDCRAVHMRAVNKEP